MSIPSLVELLEAGVHFGHETSRWNPKMRPYIFTTRNRVHVLNLQQTRSTLEEAAGFARRTAAHGGSILFVGTKRQARSIVKAHAERCGMPYVTTRWLGGTFTNFDTILKSITKLDELRQKLAAPDAGVMTKKERAVVENEIRRMEEVLEGIKNVRKIPDAVFLVGAHDEKIAVKEARRKNIPMIAIVDTNADPEGITYAVPGNDDAVRSLELLVGAIANAIIEGKREAGEPTTGAASAPASPAAAEGSQP